MGHNSKKKKKKPRAGRGRGADHATSLEDDQDAIAEELTALAAIFQEDFAMISEQPDPHFKINIRPYLAAGNVDASATLVVRCLPGYPHKCPKLQILPCQHLSEDDSNKLLLLLNDQANIYAREGRVMIFVLVEAAQEFLAEIGSLQSSPLDSFVPSTPSMKVKSLESMQHGAAPSENFYICSTIDLYSDLSGDSTSWYSLDSKIKNEHSSKNGRSFNEQTNKKKSRIQSESPHRDVVAQKIVKQDLSHANPQQSAVEYHETGAPAPKLNAVDEADEEIQGATSSDDEESIVDSVEKSYDSTEHQLEDVDSANVSLYDDNHSSESMPISPSSFFTVTYDSPSMNNKKDLILVHLLRQAYSSKETSSLLPEISSELCRLGILTHWAKDLVVAPAPVFNKTLEQAFEQQMIFSQLSNFWKADSIIVSENPAKPSSRYLSDFEVVRSLGHGGFGHVALCKNKLDGRQYAVKKIRLKDKSAHVNEKIIREVATLSRLQHQHVVRYYQAWVETEFGSSDLPTVPQGSNISESTSYSYGDISLSAVGDIKQEYAYLYIQMEYCPKTLRQVFESYDSSLDIDYAWHMFRQIVEGLVHIHSQGIIHRDLTPSNIFFDARNDIKIGDFGLAKFLKLEQLDQEQYMPTDATGVSIDGTSQVGTYFYTAPEIEHKWPHINEKVDMYSLGIIFFELWHPFVTAMERHLVLSDLKQKGVLPSSWAGMFPDQAALLKRLLSSSPSERPSAIEVLQNDLPPRMEDEWLNDVLRMIQSPEDSYVYDRVISTIFNEERWVTKNQRQHDDSNLKTFGDESFVNSSQFDNEREDCVIEIFKEVFRQHCAKRFQVAPLNILQRHTVANRKTLKILTEGGNMLELCYELRSPFVTSIITNQISSFKRYEISSVYRKAVGRSTPGRFMQGDFDIVGGALPITEAEVIKVVMDITAHFFPANAIEVRLNHGQLLESVWSWVGITSEHRQNIAELLSLITRFSPNSTGRKSNWKFVRRQLLQDLHLSEDVVDRLQKADIRFCGSADQTLARLRGTLSFDKATCKALEELSALLSFLRVWSIEQQVSVDVLMPPTEYYHRSLFFQVYIKDINLGASSDASLLATGGRYDYLVEKMWDKGHKSNPPGAVGVSIALEKIVIHSSMETRLPRMESSTSVLVCSTGKGGLLHERMELAAELWNANIKAEFVPQIDPSRKEQFDYAADHDIKCLIFISEAGLSPTDRVKVRHMDLKKEKGVTRDEVARFLSDAMSSQFRNLTIWS